MNYWPESPTLSSVVMADRCTFAIPSKPDWIEPTVQYLKERALLCGACQGSRSNKLVIALHEAVTNAIIHGNLEISSDLKESEDDSFAQTLAERSSDPNFADRAVAIDVQFDGNVCRWSITDEGNGFDVQTVLNKSEINETDLWLSSGRGILLIRSFMDGLDYEQGGRRAILTLNRESGEEKRIHERFPVHRRVEVAPINEDGSVDWDAAYQAITQNYSETGLGIIQEKLATTDRVIIGIESEGRQTMYLPAQIRHCRNVQEGLVELGCQFQISVNPPPHRQALEPVEVAVEGLLDKFRRVPMAHSDRRKHSRESYSEQIQILDGEGRITTAIARDLSKGGIAFISPVQIPQREKRTIVLPHGGDKLRVVAQIVRCTLIHQGFYDVGARFVGIEPLSEG